MKTDGGGGGGNTYLLRPQPPPPHCHWHRRLPSPLPLQWRGRWPPRSVWLCPCAGPYAPSPGSKPTATNTPQPWHSHVFAQQRKWSIVFRNNHCCCRTYRFHFMLLQNLVQFLPLLVVEVEVLALGHGLGSHHFGDGGPIPTILEEAWN